jgi:esterase/lipase
MYILNFLKDYGELIVVFLQLIITVVITISIERNRSLENNANITKDLDRFANLTLEHAATSLHKLCEFQYYSERVKFIEFKDPQTLSKENKRYSDLYYIARAEHSEAAKELQKSRANLKAILRSILRRGKQNDDLKEWKCFEILDQKLEKLSETFNQKQYVDFDDLKNTYDKALLELKDLIKELEVDNEKMYETFSVLQKT